MEASKYFQKGDFVRLKSRRDPYTWTDPGVGIVQSEWYDNGWRIYIDFIMPGHSRSVVYMQQSLELISKEEATLLKMKYPELDIK